MIIFEYTQNLMMQKYERTTWICRIDIETDSKFGDVCMCVNT